MSAPTYLWVIAALTLSSAAFAGPEGPKPPSQEVKTEALKRFNRGVELSKEGDARSALIEFRRAYELMPNYRVLYNIGQMQYELQDYAAALQSFEEYLKQGGKEIQKKRKTEVDKEIDKLRNRVASATITVNVAGAEVRIDETSIGKAPLEKPLLLNPGKRKISASASGWKPSSKTLELASGDTVQVELKLEEEKAPEPPSPPPPPPPPPPSRTHWIAWGVTGALGLSAGVTGYLALRASSRLEEQQGQLPVARSELDRTHSQLRTFSLATDILGGATLAAGAVATYLTLRRPTSETTVSIGPASVAVGGRF